MLLLREMKTRLDENIYIGSLNYANIFVFARKQFFRFQEGKFWRNACRFSISPVTSGHFLATDCCSWEKISSNNYAHVILCANLPNSFSFFVVYKSYKFWFLEKKSSPARLIRSLFCTAHSSLLVSATQHTSSFSLFLHQIMYIVW